MSAGILTLTNNSDAVTGAGTTFTTELAAGDFIVTTVGGITYTLPVKSIGSDTQVTLISKYPGPTQAGVAWRAIPRESQNQVTAELVAQTTAALRGLNYDKSNWQAVFSASGDITVMLPDGSSFSGPSWKKIADLLEALDPDHLDTVAAQIHADATQVAADKASAAASATTATQKATAAAGSASTASTKAGAAAASAKEAANSAASIHPENILHKDQNLDDLADKSAARSHLDVYSRAETDGKDSDLSVRMESINTDLLAKSVATNNRIDYALISPVANPSLGSRTVHENPFGNNTPVICVCEIFHAGLQKWTTTPWIYSGGNNYGMISSYSQGEGIVLTCGATSFVATSSNCGASQAFAANYSTVSPVRIHVWKITE